MSPEPKKASPFSTFVDSNPFPGFDPSRAFGFVERVAAASVFLFVCCEASIRSQLRAAPTGRIRCKGASFPRPCCPFFGVSVRWARGFSGEGR